MPRKKKRSSKKPPLRFEESPVNIVKNLPSPLRSCDNPVTAEVVPVNESSRFPWVSPQFQGHQTQTPRRSRRRLQLASRSAQASRLSVSKRPLSHLKPLCFVSDGATANPDEDDASSCDNLVLKDDDSVEKQSKKPKRREQFPENLVDQFEETEHDFPTESQPQSGPSSPRMDINTPPPCPLTSVLTPRPENYSGSEPVERLSQATLQIPGTGQGVDSPSCVHSEQSEKENSVAVGEQEPNVGSFGFTVNTQQPNANWTSKQQAAPAAEQSVRASEFTDITPQRPVRNGLKILAFDTPEADYGLTVRQRVLKRYRRQRTATK